MTQRLERTPEATSSAPRLPAGFVAVCATTLVASIAATVYFCRSMSGGMEMPGGWRISATWMRMPGQSWTESAAMFTLMWLPMMIAMMLPSLVPVLRRYLNTVDRRGIARPGPLTTVVGAGYFFVWTMFGLVTFAAGAALTSIEARQAALARAVPLAAGVIVLVAGTIQFTKWKAYRLVSCREAHSDCCVVAQSAGSAWRHGLRLGLDCSYCCASLMLSLLVIGVMDLRALAAVTVAITAERVLPNGERVARVVGYLVVGVGLLLIVQAVGLV